MALPVLQTIPDCADFSQTVLPYINQLYELPQQIFRSISQPEELKALYISTNPFITALAFSLLIVPIVFVLSEINRNYSQIDRIWSILPTVYNAHYAAYAHLAGLPTQKIDTLATFSAIWSLRLSFNYWRKGGYSIGSEDYRWAILRKKISPPLFVLFNLGFISFWQSILLFLITTPTYVIFLSTRISPDFEFADVVFSRLLLAFILLSFFADQQQWNYQQAKKRYQATAKVPIGYTQEDLDRGFIVTGLWAWVRHPNFAAEQTVWFVLYQWSCWTSNTFWNWTAVGPFLYAMLFQGSTPFTESISASKYPEYREYQARVGCFIPRLSTDAKGDFSTTTTNNETMKKNK
ncbi:MAG: hypothetical protein M1834_009735 [Cirrosporium novae-zelandiae]|nr:MAG: hypothetical protein M1834_009735 [Cirrosporium novae-zelandiae]